MHVCRSNTDGFCYLVFTKNIKYANLSHFMVNIEQFKWKLKREIKISFREQTTSWDLRVEPFIFMCPLWMLIVPASVFKVLLSTRLCDCNRRLWIDSSIECSMRVFDKQFIYSNINFSHHLRLKNYTSWLRRRLIINLIIIAVKPYLRIRLCDMPKVEGSEIFSDIFHRFIIVFASRPLLHQKQWYL